MDGAAFQQAMDANVSDAALADLRLEMMLCRAADDEAERREFLEAFHSAGVTCIFQNAGENMSGSFERINLPHPRDDHLVTIDDFQITFEKE